MNKFRIDVAVNIALLIVAFCAGFAASLYLGMRTGLLGYFFGAGLGFGGSLAVYNIVWSVGKKLKFWK